MHAITSVPDVIMRGMEEKKGNQRAEPSNLASKATRPGGIDHLYSSTRSSLIYGWNRRRNSSKRGNHSYLRLHPSHLIVKK